MPPTAKILVAGLVTTLARQGVDCDRVIAEFGQVPACEARERGRRFSLSDHVRGLLLSQLSNQRAWGPIAANLDAIRQVFLDYDPAALEAADPVELAKSIQALRCGNRQIAKQMACLAENIRTFRRIEKRHGSVDAFITSAPPDTIAKALSAPGPYKLQHVGLALAFEYLRNVGIRAAKPDLHVCRILGQARLGYSQDDPCKPEEANPIIDRLAREAGCSATYLDNLLWLFCAQDYGKVCGAEPRCQVCALAGECAHGFGRAGFSSPASAHSGTAG